MRSKIDSEQKPNNSTNRIKRGKNCKKNMKSGANEEYTCLLQLLK